MKILILHQYFKTPEEGGGIRTWYLGKALIQQGYEVVVITTHNQPKEAIMHVEGMEVHYLPIRYANEMGFWARMRAFLAFANQAAKKALSLKGYSLVYAISTPLSVAWAARTIKRKTGVPYFFEVGDLWPEAPVQLGWLKNPLFKWLAYRWERMVYRDAKTLIGLSPAISKYMQEIAPHKTVLTVTNFADTDFFRPNADRISAKSLLGFDPRPMIVYTGALGQVNHLEYFLDLAALFPAWQFVVMGEGARKNALELEVKNRALHQVTFRPHGNKAEVARLLAAADAVYISYGPQQVLETGSPNKYFDALAAGKPVLLNFSGWICEEVVSQSCGLYLPPGQEAQWKTVVESLMLDSTRLKAMGQCARALAEEQYTVQHQIQPLLDRLNVFKKVRGLA
jgi:glycosyltransferase involved in cell wall biosynthesis